MSALPLSALFSQAVVAFTIELDNEFEHRAAHRTTLYGRSARGGVWLASLAMWFNCMRFVDAEGISIRDLAEKARMGTNLDGMRRWGYITIEPRRPKVDSLLRATPKGLAAREVWEPLFEAIERRWEDRFHFLGDLRSALRPFADPVLPDFMPIVHYGLWTRVDEGGQAAEQRELPLISLLAKPLIAYAIEFESQSDVSLAICANVLRVIDGKARVKTLPEQSGVSKEAIAMAVGFLEKREFAKLASEGRTRVITLTDKGVAAREKYLQLTNESELPGVRHLLEQMQPRLFEGLEPYPDGWRAKVPRPSTLPHFPMVLHRGGYPDGS